MAGYTQRQGGGTYRQEIENGAGRVNAQGGEQGDQVSHDLFFLNKVFLFF